MSCSAKMSVENITPGPVYVKIKAIITMGSHLTYICTYHCICENARFQWQPIIL